MYLIYVQKHGQSEFSVKFKPVKQNLDRMRAIPTATFDGEKSWICELRFFNEFEDTFKGEIIYMTLRHELLGHPPPPIPSMYQKIPRHPINGIKAPYSLYDYQKFGANFLACIAGGTGHAFLIDGVGTGKTIQSIAGAQIMQQQGQVDTVIVFCKASLKYQWLRDGIEKFTSDKGIVIDGTKKQREKQYAEAIDTKYRYVILNYELLLHDFDLIESLVKDKGVKLILADEAHKLSNPKGKMNKLLKTLVQPLKKTKYPGVDYIFFLTATPLASKVEQIYGLFSIRRPDMFGKFSEFAKNHMKYSFNGRHSELIGYRNLDEIREKTWKFMLRRTSKEISMELPDIVEIFLDIELTPLQVKIDKLAQAELESISMMLDTIDRANTPAKQIEALEGTAQGMFYVRKAAADHPILFTRSQSPAIRKKFGDLVLDSPHKDKSPKMDEMMDLVDQLVTEGGEKIIIFSEYETMVQVVREYLTKESIDHEIYTGKMDTKEKDAAVTRYLTDDNCNILVGTDAMAEGLNLQQASTIIMVDLPWNSDVYEQRKGRIQRGGSKHTSVKIINLFARNGIDPVVWEAIRNKQELFNYMVENTEQQSQALREIAGGF